MYFQALFFQRNLLQVATTSFFSNLHTVQKIMVISNKCPRMFDSFFSAKGLMTHGTFNARNCDAGLRGVAFDAGAFDSWKIDAE